jgi:hypothetical protein
MSEQPFMDKCLELEKRIEVLESHNKRLVSALIMAKKAIPGGMKPEHQQIDDALTP